MLEVEEDILNYDFYIPERFPSPTESYQSCLSKRYKVDIWYVFSYKTIFFLGPNLQTRYGSRRQNVF